MSHFLKVIIIITVGLLPLATCQKATNADHGIKYMTGDPRKCLKRYNTLKRFEVFPGTGWDNLRNMDAGNVMVYNYSLCKTTLDGRFLITDDVDTIPRKSSKLNTYAEVISHYTDYTSVDAHSINVHAGGSYDDVSISGSFSDSYQQVKRTQIKERSVTTRVDVRYVRYTAKLRKVFKLDPDFKIKLTDIADSIDRNKTNEAIYKSQLLVRDYGTHYLTSVDVGAVLAQEDQISSDFLSTDESSTKDMEAAAGVSFLNVFNFGTAFNTSSSTSNTEKYQRLRLSSNILTFGGPQFLTQNFTINDWANKVENNMVAVDRQGDPIHFLITEANLPDLSAIQVSSLKNLVKGAVNLYYTENAYPGCTHLESPNFSSAGNIDDGSCSPPINSTRFGGVFQTCVLDRRSTDGDICLDKKMNQKNLLTGNYSCPDGYETVRIHSANLLTRTPFSNCFICEDRFNWCCPNSEYYHYALSSGNYSMYWCGAVDNVPPNSGYLFGGIFTSEKSNPLTQNVSCPISFYPRQRLGVDIQVCVSADYEVGRKYAQMFGGLFSCDSGNPLAVNNNTREVDLTSGGDFTSPIWPKQCPVGYSQHLAYVDQECEISYCFKSGHTGFVFPNIRRPPFINDTEPTHPSNHPPPTSDGHVYTITIVVTAVVSTVGAIVLTSIACVVKQKRSKGYISL